MRNAVRNFYRSEAGATAIEYSLIAAFIAIAIITVLQQVGTEVQGPFRDAEAGLKKRASLGG